MNPEHREALRHVRTYLSRYEGELARNWRPDFSGNRVKCLRAEAEALLKGGEHADRVASGWLLVMRGM